MRLGEVEEGRSFVDVTYNDKDFAVPAGWKLDVPRRGRLRFCYCRGLEVCERVRLRHAGTAAWPAGFRERAGIGWVAVDRLRRVQRKLRAKFPDAEASFRQIDSDGGGTLNQVRARPPYQILTGVLCNICMYVCMCACACVRVRVRVRAHARARVRAHACALVRVCACVCRMN